MKYIATISGGKDSVTMCDLLLKNGYPVDYIIFYDTLQELPAMYEYVERLKEYFMLRYNKEIIVTKPMATFEEWCFGVIKDKNADKFGWIRGVPMAWSEPCYWRRISKVQPSDKLLKELKIKDATFYIGFTKDENRSVSDTDNFKYSYPLRDIFNMTEANCQEYLINQDMENELYRYFTRTGCGFCPAMSDKALYQVYKNFKDTWEYMKLIENRLVHYKNSGFNVKNCHWRSDYKTLLEMEKKFIKLDQQGSLFDFSDEPLKDCFCKI